MHWIGVYLDRNAPRGETSISAMANVLILAINFIIIEFSVMSFYDKLDNMGEAIYALMQIVAFVQSTGTYISFALNKYAIFDCFAELQELINESACA